jgi:uncharacterized protein (TIGR02246 family)
MSKFFWVVVLSFAIISVSQGQDGKPGKKQEEDVKTLINRYSQARENGDTLLLKAILTTDVDQLVSDGEWRNGIDASVKGMLSSSANSPGTRTLSVEKLRFLDKDNVIVDCKYEIKNTDGSVRKMWSCFVVVSEKGSWKISAIRNMLPR